ncbi:MAG: hypothetical protein Q9171_002504 [Xanthocarpia ochracea]
MTIWFYFLSTVFKLLDANVSYDVKPSRLNLMQAWVCSWINDLTDYLDSKSETFVQRSEPLSSLKMFRLQNRAANLSESDGTSLSDDLQQFLTNNDKIGNLLEQLKAKQKEEDSILASNKISALKTLFRNLCFILPLSSNSAGMGYAREQQSRLSKLMKILSSEEDIAKTLVVECGTQLGMINIIRDKLASDSDLPSDVKNHLNMFLMEVTEEVNCCRDGMLRSADMMASAQVHLQGILENLDFVHNRLARREASSMMPRDEM